MNVNQKECKNCGIPLDIYEDFCGEDCENKYSKDKASTINNFPKEGTK